MSHAMAWKKRAAAKVAAKEGIERGTGSSEGVPIVKLYILMQTAMDDDLARLHKHKSIADKSRIKRDELIEKYSDFIEQYLESGQRFDNEVFAYFIIWLFDIGDIDRGLELASVAIDQEQPLPGCFRRDDWPTIIADEVLTWGQNQVNGGHSPLPYIADVLSLMESGAWSVHESIRGKYYKLCGEFSESIGQPGIALQRYRQAASLGQKVKTKITALEKQIVRDGGSIDAVPVSELGDMPLGKGDCKTL